MKIITTFVAATMLLAPAAPAQDLSAVTAALDLRALSGLSRLAVLANIDREVERRTPRPAWAPQDSADSLYREGRRAINDEDYPRAARIFAQLVRGYPDSEYAGDALYWQAWATYRHAVNTRVTRAALSDALAALDRQARDYPRSRLIADGRELRAQLRAEQAKLGDADAAQEVTTRANQLAERGCPSDDDDERLIAIQGLMQMDAESALPILRDVLRRRDRCSESLRQQAVFLVSQRRGDESLRMLLDVARNDPSDEVRGAAIHWLGQSRSELVLPALDSILMSSTDRKTREAAVFALSQQRDPRAVRTLRRVVEDARMPVELRAQALFWIGQTRGQSRNGEAAGYMREIFRSTSERQLKEQVLHAMSQSHDPEAGQWLLEVARDKGQPVEMRKMAIFWVSQRPGADLNTLSSLYDQMRGEREIQEQLIHAFSQRREPAATDKLIEIASKEQDRELRKNAIFWLGQRKDPKAVQFLRELINK